MLLQWWRVCGQEAGHVARHLLLRDELRRIVLREAPHLFEISVARKVWIQWLEFKLGNV